MSAALARLTCTHCTFEQGLVDTQVKLRYEIGRTHYFDHLSTSAWCLACERIQDVEDIPTSDAFSAEIIKEKEIVGGSRFERLKDRIGLTISRKRHWANVRLHSLNLQLEWRLRRQSPPRCLSCGSTDIRFIDWSAIAVAGDLGPARHVSQKFEHSCGGKLVRSYRTEQGEIYLKLRARRYVLDPEGNVLRMEDEENGGLNDEMKELLNGFDRRK